MDQLYGSLGPERACMLLSQGFATLPVCWARTGPYAVSLLEKTVLAPLPQRQLHYPLQLLSVPE